MCVCVCSCVCVHVCVCVCVCVRGVISTFLKTANMTFETSNGAHFNVGNTCILSMTFETRNFAHSNYGNMVDFKCNF